MLRSQDSGQTFPLIEADALIIREIRRARAQRRAIWPIISTLLDKFRSVPLSFSLCSGFSFPDGE